jgi:hypothetical protein
MYLHPVRIDFEPPRARVKLAQYFLNKKYSLMALFLWHNFIFLFYRTP